ncbi:hypothetical protein BR93DRAFT_872567 [Coniochaeta sp. PMI_546]|nr:hypothetical protein BR93DRAFT_872567 [Coniochaeta sp. PMI_546]
MRVGPGHAGDDVAAHGPARPASPSDGPAFVSDLPGPALHDASWQAVQNAGHPPDQFADGRNLYLERPLPPPPPPKNAAPVTFAMPARPSTSGGPNAKASAFLGLTTRPTADKRLSKDDMYLTGYTGGQRKKGLQPYRVGMRGGLPTPEDSPDMDYPALSPPMAIPARMHTPDTLSSGEIQIGMALGSPSHPPEAVPWESQLPLGRQPLTPPDLYQTATAPVVQRQKTQRRKLFGGLFGSRKKEEQPRASPEPADSGSVVSSMTTTSMASQPFGESTPTRSNTVADRKAPRYKPIIIRSNTLPVVESPMYEPRAEHQQSNYLSPDPPAPSLGSGPLLDIEIPSIKMERYSVMFSNVLNPQATSSSLLARRQATLEKLKTINDRILHEEEEKERLRQRRATSPQPTKSPGFTLFPPGPNRHHGSSPLTPRRLARSNTSPALLPSPSRPSFDLHVPRKERKTVTIISPRSMEQRNPGPPSALSRASEQPERTVPTAEAEGFQFGPDVSGLILDSPQSMDEPSSARFASVVDAQPLRPTIPEPEWQMISGPAAAGEQPPAPPSSSASSTTTRRSPSSSASSVHTHVTRPSVDIDESDSALKTAVEISIARQISLSRQQRTLLRPLKTDVGQLPPSSGRPRAGTAAAAAAAAAAGASPVKKMVVSRKEGRVVETKMGTPTEMVDSHPAAHRKSERVVLDGL